MAKAKERPVVVCTSYRGVFFGYATDTSGEVINLKNARNCVYWPQSQHGFVSLASRGPDKGARVGDKADMELRGITCVVECTCEAVKQWEAGLWS